MNKQKAWSLDCPANAEHGPLIELQPSEQYPSGRLYCPDQSHDGHPATHPDGALDQTQAFFTLDEAEAALQARGS